jgi:hypothetical protein
LPQWCYATYVIRCGAGFSVILAPDEGKGEDMNGEGSELSLQGLAQRIETQAHRLERMERENAELRHKVATLESSQTRLDGEAPASEFAGRVSRRSLLSKAGAAALGAVAAGTLLNAREAKAATDTFDTVWCADLIADTGGVRTTHKSGGRAVWALNTSGPNPTVDAEHRGSGVGVFGKGVIGVRGHSSTDGEAGVYGENTARKGPGVFGRGVIGVRGHSSTTGQAGVYGENTAGGPGVVGDGKSSDAAGVFGRNVAGYGGRFEGGKAQLLLKPGGKAGKPTTGAHSKGELYMDSQATLWVCVASGTPGTWRRVTTTT